MLLELEVLVFRELALHELTAVEQPHRKPLPMVSVVNLIIVLHFHSVGLPKGVNAYLQIYRWEWFTAADWSAGPS